MSSVWPDDVEFISDKFLFVEINTLDQYSSEGFNETKQSLSETHNVKKLVQDRGENFYCC